MTTQVLKETLGLRELCLPEPKREVTTGYAGDLLSWVMGRAPADAAWVTIMSNVNIVAVAMLRDIAVVIVAEGAEVGADVVERAAEQGINLLCSDKDAFTLCKQIGDLI